jgi:hypothetical protein
VSGIFVAMRAPVDREGVSVRLGLEGQRADVGHPDLDRSQALPAQPFTCARSLSRVGRLKFEGRDIVSSSATWQLLHPIFVDAGKLEEMSLQA